jgi:hypothetical protein
MPEENQRLNLLDEGPKTLKTYSSDVAEAIRNNEGSVIRVALAEKSRAEYATAREVAQGTRGKKLYWGIGGAIFTILASALIFLITKNDSANQPVKQEFKDPEAFVSYEDISYLDISRSVSSFDLITLIKSETAQSLQTNAIKNIILYIKDDNGQANFVGSRNFVSLAGFNMPDALIRSLNEDFMIGVYKNPESNTSHTFLMFSSKDYSISYLAMLNWEKSLFEDMFNLFSINISSETKNILENRWQDILVENKDARFVLGREEKPVLLYSFLNKNYFVITDDASVLKEINTRLLNKNAKPL